MGAVVTCLIVCECVVRHQESVETYLNRGQLFVMAGRWDHALWDFSCALKLNNDCVVAYINRGPGYCGGE